MKTAIYFLFGFSNIFYQMADLPEPIADGCIVITNITGIFDK